LRCGCAVAPRLTPPPPAALVKEGDLWQRRWTGARPFRKKVWKRVHAVVEKGRLKIYKGAEEQHGGPAAAAGRGGSGSGSGGRGKLLHDLDAKSLDHVRTERGFQLLPGGAEHGDAGGPLLELQADGGGGEATGWLRAIGVARPRGELGRGPSVSRTV